MNTCNTCRYWIRDDNDDPDYKLGLGTCGAATMFWDATEWNEGGDGRRIKAKFLGRKFFVQDGSDYKAILLTLPTFGCIEHETQT